MTIVHSLMQEKADLLKKARALSDTASREKRVFTPEEQASYDSTMAEISNVNTSLERERALEEQERSMAIRTIVEDSRRPPTERRTEVLGNQDRFATFGEQLMAVVQAAKTGGRVVDPRLLAAPLGMSEAVAADGGYLVMQDHATELLRRTYEMGAILSLVRRVPISANANGLKINAVAETSRLTGSRWGGVQSYWLSEAGTPTAKKPVFRIMELSLKKLIGLCYATDELLLDATALESVITQAFSEEFMFMLEDAIIEGDGVGKPLGILNSPCLVSVAKETSQAAATVQSANIFKMWSRLWSRSRPNAVWLINQDVEPQLYSMVIPVKNVAGSENVGGSAVYLPAGTLANQPLATLMGRPVIACEYCPTVGTLGDIVLADFSQYLTIGKEALQYATSIHVAFTTDEQAFRFTLRTDGQPIWNAALTPFKGSNTQSPFVALATRA